MRNLILIGIILLSVSCRDVCNKENACSDGSEPEDVQEVSEKQNEKTDIVIRDKDSLPACDDDNQNMTAYRESTGKNFVCKQNAWEEFKPYGYKEADQLTELWKSAKRIYPEDDYLTYVCSSILEQNPKHECNEYIQTIQNESDDE